MDFFSKKNKNLSSGSVNHIDHNYMSLVAGIIEQAEKDFFEALRKKDSHDIKALKRWFLSDWGQALSNNNGQLIIDRIENETKKKG